MNGTKTRCLLCNKICNPDIHLCVKKNKWLNYYGRFEAVFDVEKLIKTLPKAIREVESLLRKHKKIDMWKFSEVLPVKEKINLNEGGTPLYRLKNYLKKYKVNIFIKNEGTNPSGVYKDRESSIVVNRCLESGIRKIALASTGNAAQSISLYARKANIQTLLFISGKTSKEKIWKMLNNGAKLIILKYGSMEDAFKANRDLSSFLASIDVIDCNPGIDWLRREGSKTIAYEIYSQMNIVPDWIITACGNGSSIRAIFKGFKEMKQAKIVNKLPKMIGVQIKGGDPIPKGVLLKQLRRPVEIQSPSESLGDSASASFDYFAAVRAIIESKGNGIGVEDKEISRCLSDFIFQESALLDKCIPEVVTAQILPALEIFMRNGTMKSGQNVVLFFSSHAINDRENIKKLLIEHGNIKAWKRIENLIPIIEEKLTKLETSQNIDKNVSYVSNNLEEIKDAVKKILAI